MSSYFLHNEPCPKCREKGKDRHGNNLGVFSDGHVRCWSCGYYKGASGMCVATKTLPKHCQAFTTTGGYNDFMQKV